MIETEVTKEPIPLTDMGKAERFARQHGDKLKYVDAMGKWFCWNGRYHEIDDTRQVYRLAKQVSRSIHADAAMFGDKSEQKKINSWEVNSQSRARLEAMVALAKDEEPIPARHTRFDTGIWLINCENCTYDLSRRKASNHYAGDMITKCTHVEYPIDSSFGPMLWLEFLSTIFGGDTDLIAFVQRLFGSALVGEQVEHLLVLLYGTGATGKSVFANVIQKAMGDYAGTAAPGLLMAKRNEQHPTALADLWGKRLLVVSETRDRESMDTGLVKSITGGDKIKARFMKQDFFEFEPSHMPVICTNHKPKLETTDYGTWRRLMMLPFEVTIPPEKQDNRLAEKLEEELPAILKWLIQGCLDWQDGRLEPPTKVVAATDQYRSEEDTLGSFVGECCLVGTEYKIKTSQLYDAYRKLREMASLSVIQSLT